MRLCLKLVTMGESFLLVRRLSVKMTSHSLYTHFDLVPRPAALTKPSKEVTNCREIRSSNVLVRNMMGYGG